MTKAQQVAMEMLSLEAIDLYIISEELRDAFEDELMRKDPASWELMVQTLESCKTA